MKVDSPFLLFLATLVFGMLAVPGVAQTHVVREGETFYAIARTHGVSVERLMAHNGFRDPLKLQVGKALKIPPEEVKVATKTTRLEPKPLMRKSLRVIIDAGHGGKDRGAVWGGVHEADLNLKVALRVEESLKKLGYSVTMTRRSDAFVSLSQRAEVTNRCRNGIFISIHFNASLHTSVKGAETFYVGEKGAFLARSIQEKLVSGLKVRNRGCRHRNFAVLHQTACPAVLVECGFISNPSERARCSTPWYQATVAQAIVQGVQRYDQNH